MVDRQELNYYFGHSTASILLFYYELLIMGSGDEKMDIREAVIYLPCNIYYTFLIKGINFF